MRSKAAHNPDHCEISREFQVIESGLDGNRMRGLGSASAGNELTANTRLDRRAGLLLRPLVGPGNHARIQRRFDSTLA